MRVADFHWSLLLSFAIVAAAQRGRAETQLPTAQHTTTLVVFADRHIPEGEWEDLLSAIRVGAAEIAKGASAFDSPDKTKSAGASALRAGLTVVRGDTMPAGQRIDEPVVVHLHGDCKLLPRPLYVRADRLGWVKDRHGHIEPFIHVECTQLVNMLGPMALGMDQPRRDMVMAEAITRVILHEWIHVATQNPGHAERGVAQAHFGVEDLLADDPELRANKRGKKG
jgi:hypothetical protein